MLRWLNRRIVGDHEKSSTFFRINPASTVTYPQKVPVVAIRRKRNLVLGGLQ
jgi:hypothetical protein